MISAQADDSHISCYISGVGVGFTPSGAVLGGGMKRRMLEGYAFLSQNYRAGDDICIFGFSRGAHQARALAGMISYSGLLPPELATTHEQAMQNAGKCWSHCLQVEENLDHEFNKGMKSSPNITWQQVIAKRKPPIPLYLHHNSPVPGRYAEINLLGIWDTVPGSLLKCYTPYREVFDDEKGTRYKVGAYPPIRRIAHAMALDEMRDKFAPIQVDQPIMRSRTLLNEVWFPGVHSDVGGGYSDTNALSTVSFQWMIEQINAAHVLRQPLPSIKTYPKAPQHDSMLHFGGKLAYDAIPRQIHGKISVLHPSVREREQAFEIDRHTDNGFVKQKYTPQAIFAPCAKTPIQR